MKKLISILIAAVICLSCVLPAFADMDSPAFKEYKAYVSDPDGVDVEVYNYDIYEYETITIPYNAEITVTGEYDGKAVCEYEGHNYIEISLDDLSKEKSEIDMSEAYKLEHPVTYIVISEDGAPIRKGPADSYDEIGTIPNGTEITVTYGTDEDTYFLPWAYCTYGETSGWIYVEQYMYGFDFATKLTEDCEKTGRVMVLKDGIKLLGKPGYAVSEEESVSGYPEDSVTSYVSDEIPAGTEFTYDTYYESGQSFFALVEYNGVKGWLESGDRNNDLFSTYVTDDAIYDILIYGGPAEITSEYFGGGEKLGEIPENTTVISYLNASKLVSEADGSDADNVIDYENFDYDDYCYKFTSYVEYNGIKGWVTCGYDTEFNFFQLRYACNVKIAEDTDVFTDSLLTEKAETIKAGTKCIWLEEDYNSEGTRIMAFCRGGKPVFAKSGDNDEAVEFEYESSSLTRREIEQAVCGAPLELDYSIVNFTHTESNTEKAGETTTAAASDGLKTTVIVIVIVVAVVCLASVVTIVLVKKKKDSKKAETES